MDSTASDTIPAAFFPHGWEVLDGDGNASGVPVSRKFTVEQGGSMDKSETAVALAAGAATVAGTFWAYGRIQELTDQVAISDNQIQELRNCVGMAAALPQSGGKS